jgi:hypothetical protein
MGKYDPLNEQLRESKRNEVRFSFREIEKLLGADLPKGAREKKTWWTNEDTGHASAWVAAGYTADVDMDGQTVTYRRAGGDEGALGDVRERLDAGLEQAREIFATGAAQAREVWDRAEPTVRRAAPWMLLGAAVAVVVGVFVRSGMRDRG